MGGEDCVTLIFKTIEPAYLEKSVFKILIQTFISGLMLGMRNYFGHLECFIHLKRGTGTVHKSSIL